MGDSGMFIDIRHEPFEASMAEAAVCARCGAFLVWLQAIDTRQLHDQWHQRNDHAGPIPNNDDEAWT